MATISQFAHASHLPLRAVARDGQRPIGESMDGWELTRLICAGRSSSVFQARPLGNDSDGACAYAIKRLSPGWEHEAAAIELFKREATVGAEVSHPHLVAILASHVDTEPRYLVMPWLEGETLADRLIAAQGRASIAAAIWYVRQVAEALDALHQAGWMHGDVTPKNILVSSAGHATLVDLGFARRPGERAVCLDRALLGTPDYLAPEAISTKYWPDIRSDIYSLGVTLYETLCGRRTQADQGQKDRPAPRGRATVRNLRRPNALMPQSLVQLLAKMLSHDPLRRPQTPRELIDWLLPIEIETLADRTSKASWEISREEDVPSFPAPARSAPALAHKPG